MQSKIKAAIRIRPFLNSQLAKGYINTLFTIDQNKKQISITQQNNKKSFHFDYLFSQESTQQDIYHQCKIDTMINKAIQGYHCTIFAYGQTGSGKTYTMQGTQQIQSNSKPQLNGLIPKAISTLFTKIKTLPQKSFTISISFLQIYNEKIYDLLNPFSLNPKNLGENLGGLRLRWNKNQQFTAQNLYIFQCKNVQQLMKYFLYGLKNRINSSHKLNINSSRSHSILTIKLQSFQHSQPSHILSSKIQFVDLAGSERIGLTGTQGKLAKQSIDINKSLFTLRQVITILSDNNKSKQQNYVPYRSSKLTSILKQSIGGNSYCLMIACITPNDTFLQQNISTLTYATKATYITNQPIINDDPRSKIIYQLKQQVKNLVDQLNKANQHIQLISNIKQNNKCQLSNTNNEQNHKKYSIDNLQLAEFQPTLDFSLNRKLSQSNNPNNLDKFSDRLVESINMVRELLKSNKQMREQLQLANLKNNQNQLEIYQLTKQNQYLREKTGSRQQNLSEYQTLPIQTQPKPKNKSSPKFNKLPSTTTTISHNDYPLYTLPPKTNNSFSYRNTLQINSFYLNQKGTDSIPTNFNRRNINSVKNPRIIQTNPTKLQNKDIHFLTAKPNKNSWISKNCQAKKFLSFYHDPSKEENKPW